MAMLPGRSNNLSEPLQFEEVTAASSGRGEGASAAGEEGLGGAESHHQRNGSEQAKRRLDNRRSLLTIPKLGKSRSSSLSSGPLSAPAEECTSPASERAQIVAGGPNAPRKQPSKKNLKMNRKSLHFPRTPEGEAVPVPSLSSKGSQPGDGAGMDAEPSEHDLEGSRHDVSAPTKTQQQNAPAEMSERESFYSAQSMPQHEALAPAPSVGEHGNGLGLSEASGTAGRSESSGTKRRRASVLVLDRLWPFGQGREGGENDRAK